MKTLISAIVLFFALNINAQNTTVTQTFSVKGNCEQCKERIENAADIKGVKTTIDWIFFAHHNFLVYVLVPLYTDSFHYYL